MAGLGASGPRCGRNTRPALRRSGSTNRPRTARHIRLSGSKMKGCTRNRRTGWLVASRQHRRAHRSCSPRVGRSAAGKRWRRSSGQSRSRRNGRQAWGRGRDRCHHRRFDGKGVLGGYVALYAVGRPHLVPALAIAVYVVADNRERRAIGVGAQPVVKHRCVAYRGTQTVSIGDPHNLGRRHRSGGGLRRRRRLRRRCREGRHRSGRERRRSSRRRRWRRLSG